MCHFLLSTKKTSWKLNPMPKWRLNVPYMMSFERQTNKQLISNEQSKKETNTPPIITNQTDDSVVSLSRSVKQGVLVLLFNRIGRNWIQGHHYFPIRDLISLSFTITADLWTFLFSSWEERVEHFTMHKRTWEQIDQFKQFQVVGARKCIIELACPFLSVSFCSNLCLADTMSNRNHLSNPNFVFYLPMASCFKA